jgi:uncharacterized membrane protein
VPGIVELAAHGGVVAKSEATSERLGAFSDGVFAVIITIMVLDLRPPPQTTLAALLDTAVLAHALTKV